MCFQVVVAQDLRRQIDEPVESVLAAIQAKLDDYLAVQVRGIDLFNYGLVSLGMSDGMLKLIKVEGGRCTGGSLR